MMLIGTYRHQTDEKSRLRMPSKFKDALGEGFIVTKGTNGCLFCFSQTQFEELYKKLESVVIPSEIQTVEGVYPRKICVF